MDKRIAWKQRQGNSRPKNDRKVILQDYQIYPSYVKTKGYRGEHQPHQPISVLKAETKGRRYFKMQPWRTKGKGQYKLVNGF